MPLYPVPAQAVANPGRQLEIHLAAWGKLAERCVAQRFF
jgi:hypothetical protein